MSVAQDLERQIEEAMLTGFPAQLVEHPFTVELGWPARLGVGLTVEGAIAIASVPDCALRTERVQEPADAWSRRSLIDDLAAARRLPHNAVVISIEQVDHEKFGPGDMLLVRYLEPLPVGSR